MPPHKRQDVSKAVDPEDEGVKWPEGYDTWAKERQTAWIVQLFLQDRDYVPTEDERAAAAHMAEKMASASGHNQVDPNAD